jgi:GNAT superfamily N-acetyltransferase
MAYRMVRVEHAAAREHFCSLIGPVPLHPEMLAASDADQHWMLLEGSTPVARCSLWWRAVPDYQGQRVGLIGHYATEHRAAGALLTLACAQLRMAGCALAVGPMDGSTFHHYRLVTERGAEPPFFLEPDTPDGWPAHFTTNGFEPLAHYYSSLQTNLEHQETRVPALAENFAAAGVHIRSLNLEAFDDELHRIYTVVATSFTNNLLAAPISEQEFIAQYRRLLPCVEPRLVLLAEHDDKPVGFLFTIPDWLQARRGQPVDTLIVKTLAVLPEYAGQGLGSLLSARCQEIASELGFTRAIHALMHESNISRRISDAYEGRIIRRYTLFARNLVN